MRPKTAMLVTVLAAGGLLTVWSGVAEAQNRGKARPRTPQGPTVSQPRPGGGQPGAIQGYPGRGPARPGGPVYGHPGQRYPGRYPNVRASVGFHYGYYRPAYFYSPWGWYPWYPWDFYDWYGYPYGQYGPYGPRGYYGYYAYNGSSLKLEVQPKDAEVYVDGHRAGVVDQFDGFFQRLTVEAGGHDVTLFKPGFRTVTQSVYLQPGSTFKLKYVMEPLAAGEQSEPPPAPVPDPEPQTQPSPPERRFGVEPGTPEPRPGAQAPPPQPVPPRVEADARFGQLAIRVQPEGAQVFIDGEAWQGPRGADRMIVHLPAGTHRLEVRKDGYEPFVAQFEIKPGETTALNVSLVGLY